MTRSRHGAGDVGGWPRFSTCPLGTRAFCPVFWLLPCSAEANQVKLHASNPSTRADPILSA